KKDLTQVLVTHPGQIHSLDQFISFLAAGSSSSALRAEIANAEKKKIDPRQLAQIEYVPLAARVATARSEIGGMARRIAAVKEQLASARATASRVRPCLVTSCAEETFQRMIAPIVLRANIALAQLALARSKTLTSDRFSSDTMQVITDGTLDRTLRQLRLEQRD